MRSCVVVLIISAILFVPCSAGEINLNKVAVTFGTIESFQPDGVVDYPNVFYPELQLQGDFLTPGLGWESYWGYWDDGIAQVKITDAIVYSSTGHIVGLRVFVDPVQFAPEWLLPILVWGGVAHHFISFEDLGSTDYFGARGYDHTASANSWEIGARIHLSIIDPIHLQFEGRQLFYLSDTDRGKDERLSFSLGFGVGF